MCPKIYIGTSAFSMSRQKVIYLNCDSFFPYPILPFVFLHFHMSLKLQESSSVQGWFIPSESAPPLISPYDFTNIKNSWHALIFFQVGSRRCKTFSHEWTSNPFPEYQYFSLHFLPFGMLFLWAATVSRRMPMPISQEIVIILQSKQGVWGGDTHTHTHSTVILEIYLSKRFYIQYFPCFLLNCH